MIVGCRNQRKFLNKYFLQPNSSASVFARLDFYLFCFSREREMIAEMVEGCVYQESLSIFKKCYYGATLLYLFVLAFLEVTGKHLQYSKFWNLGSKNSIKPVLSSKIGMLVLYTPALFAGISSFWIFPDGGIRFMMLKSAITIHFLKRDLEVFISLSLSSFFLFFFIF